MTAAVQDRVVSRAPHVAVALAILAQLLLVRLTFWADANRVLFLGIPFGADCAFHMRFGIPCPACGLTRSVALTLYGHVEQAAALNPMGPAAVLGVALFAIGLMCAPNGGLLRRAALSYSAIAVAFWLSWWLYRVIM